MPKEHIEISNFQAGVITNVSERDIPIDAASESLNIDPTSERGSLIGIADDVARFDGSSTDFFLPHVSAIINDDGTYHWVGYQPKLYTNGNNATSAVFNSSKNPFSGTLVHLNVGGADYTTGIGPNANPIQSVCMEVNNKEVHIGQGSFETKWVGMVQYKQFGVQNFEASFGYPAATSGKLDSPTTFDDIYKAIKIGTNIYGIKFGGHYIYKFNTSTAAITKSIRRFESLQGLAEFNNSTDFVWVYDAGDTKYGKLYKYSVVLGASVEFTSTLDVPSNAEDLFDTSGITDIIDGNVSGSNGEIWFLKSIEELPEQDEDLFDGGGAWLWNIATPTADGTPTLASKTPFFKTDATAAGTAGTWWGLRNGMFYKDGTAFNDTDQDEIAETEVAFIDRKRTEVFPTEGITDIVNRSITTSAGGCDWIEYSPDTANLASFALANGRIEMTRDADTDDQGCELPAGNLSPWTNGKRVRVKATIFRTAAAADTTIKISVGGTVSGAFTITETETEFTYIAAITNNSYGVRIYSENAAATVFYVKNVSVGVACESLYTGDLDCEADSGTEAKNRYITEDIHYDKDMGILLEHIPDYGNEQENGNYTQGSDKLAIWRVDSDPTSSTFGDLECLSINDVGWSGVSSEENPGITGTSSSVVDTINKYVFIGQRRLIYAHSYNDINNVSARADIINSDNRATGAWVVGTSHGQELINMAIDENENLLFITEEEGGMKIVQYNKETGAIHNTHSEVLSIPTDSQFDGIAIDTERKIVFVSNYHGGELFSYKYHSNGLGNKPTASIVSSKVSAAIGNTTSDGPSPTLAVDTKNKLLFARLGMDAITDTLVSSFSYTNEGELSFSDSIAGHGDVLDSTIDDYGGRAGGIVSDTTGDQTGGIKNCLKVKCDSESKVLFAHCGRHIVSLEYTSSGKFEASGLDGITYKNNISIQRPFRKSNQSNAVLALSNSVTSTSTAHTDNASSGLGLGFALVQGGDDWGAISKQGLIITGSNMGILRSKSYSRNTRRVQIPRVGLMKVESSGTEQSDGIGFPICINNSISDSRNGNHIYYNSADTTEVKSQMYWIYVTNAIVPGAGDATETLDGTKGDVNRALTNSTTAAPGKMWSISNSRHSSYHKLAYTASSVGEGDNAASLYVHNTNNAVNWIDIAQDSDTAQTYDSSLSGISLRQPCVASSVASSGDNDMTLDLFEGAEAGTGKWARVEYDQSDAAFETTIGASTTNLDGILASPLDIDFELITYDEDSDRGGTGVKKDRKYFYKISYMYDGYQEAPLSGDFTYTPGEDGNLKVFIKLKSPGTLPGRVTHANLYRSDNTNLNATKPEGYYRLCKSIRLNTEWKLKTISEETNPSWGQYREYEFLDEGDLFESFESRAGYSSVLPDMDVRYGLSTQLNNTHFVSHLTHPTLDEEGGNFIAKSLPFKFDTFDYTKDILRIPDKLIAMQGFAGRIWGFTESTIYKIEPNTCYIEDTITGIGCIHRKAITVCPSGMYWADANNLYWHDGQTIHPIGEAIKANGAYSWDQADLTELNTTTEVDVDTPGAPQPVIAVYDANKNAVLFIFKKLSTNVRYANAFHIPTKRWETWELAGTFKVCDALTGPDGYVYYATNNNNSSLVAALYQFSAHSSNRRAWTWKSKDITLGSDSQHKHWHNIKIAGTNTDLSSSLVVKLDGSTVAETFAADGQEGKYTLPYGSRKGRKIKLEFSGIASTNSVDSIGLTFRRKGAK